MTWLLTSWKGILVTWGALCVAFCLVWPIITIPGRREERAMEARECERRRRLAALRASQQRPPVR